MSPCPVRGFFFARRRPAGACCDFFPAAEFWNCGSCGSGGTWKPDLLRRGAMTGNGSRRRGVMSAGRRCEGCMAAEDDDAAGSRRLPAFGRVRAGTENRAYSHIKDNACDSAFWGGAKGRKTLHLPEDGRARLLPVLARRRCSCGGIGRGAVPDRFSGARRAAEPP